MSDPDQEQVLDQVNRPVWARRDVVADFTTYEGWTDEGERAAIADLSSEVRGKRALDIGIGTGRTSTWMRLLTDAYVGVDITSEMIDAARLRHPGLDLRVADVRDLSEFGDASYDFAIFSNNGIDAVSHSDRELALCEIARVLRPGGSALISTLNKDSRSYTLKPWMRRRGAQPAAGPPEATASPAARLEKAAHLGVRLLAHPTLPWRRMSSWRGLRQLSEDHGSWGIAPLDAYAFGLLVHWTTLAAAVAEFAAAGLQVEKVFTSSDGSRVDPADWGRRGAVTCDCVHLVARRV